MPVATPIALAEDELAQVQFNAEGLVPAIVQEQGTNAVLMLAWMDREALRRTLTSGRTWFWSRSRKEDWCKGDTSGDRQWVREAYYDCDGDTLLFVVEQEGAGACHTGARSCFFQVLRRGQGHRGPVIRPTREEFGEAWPRQYSVVPRPWLELLADLHHPRGRVRVSWATNPGFLLESVEHGDRWGRWSCIGPAAHRRHRGPGLAPPGHRHRSRRGAP